MTSPKKDSADKAAEYPFAQTLLEQQVGKAKEDYKQKAYQELASGLKPKPPYLRNAVGAFVVGGLISMVGQVISNGFQAYGLNVKDAGSATAMVMVFLGALFTGLGIYDELAKFAGAGSIVPITGFANSIVAPAMEFKREGFVFGVGARMFNVAGPVLVYGFVVSVLIGLVAFLSH